MGSGKGDGFIPRIRVGISRIKRNGNLPQIPEYETEQSSGVDLRAFMEQPVRLRPLERAVIPTGIRVEIPPGWEAQIRPRSGLALKKGLTVLNSPGTIDSDYRGEVKVILVNLSDSEVTIEPGDRIAQMVFAPVARVEWEEKEELAKTARGEGGFGHTGVK